MSLGALSRRGLALAGRSGQFAVAQQQQCRLYRCDITSGLPRNRIGFAAKCVHMGIIGSSIIFWYLWGLAGIKRWRPQQPA
jgi:hypothetical protein